MLKSLTPLLTFKVSSLDIFSVMLSHVVRVNYLFYSSTFLLLVVLITTTSLEIIEKKIIPDFFTPKSNRSGLFFSFCKRVDRMVS